MSPLDIQHIFGYIKVKVIMFSLCTGYPVIDQLYLFKLQIKQRKFGPRDFDLTAGLYLRMLNKIITFIFLNQNICCG